MKIKYLSILFTLTFMFFLTFVSVAKKINETDEKDNSIVTKVEKHISNKKIENTNNNNIDKKEVEQTYSTSSLKTGEKDNWHVFSSGGKNAISVNYKSNGTFGQFAIGSKTSISYQANSGFWQGEIVIGCCVLRGDINGDGQIDISDLVGFVGYMFQGILLPLLCFEHADVNGDGEIDISDLVYLVAYMFSGGDPPVPCP